MKLLNFMTFQVFYVPYMNPVNGFSRDNRVGGRGDLRLKLSGKVCNFTGTSSKPSKKGVWILSRTK